ncbi:PREDICTED: psbQ-like protein 3, chloroplastic [Tarenaya hassleriana]|uniref:psbQ-like protein 3, chloroplastic n=1 Tax=Tarenaya hassleriana TaxID=28532 RepID=UPI00053C3387|nr:PREDICTED: psbQ-like protein 3, chloroplastic [Tarenaya hassleriana]
MALSKSLVTLRFIDQLHSPNPPPETEDSRSTPTNIITEGKRGRRRRNIVLSITGTSLAQVFFSHQISSSSSANAIDFSNLIPEPEPERTLQSAQEGIKKNAEGILGTEEMMTEEKRWREAQRELRRSAGNMKQDMYIIIQSKPPKERPLLRALYSNLFTTITKLDYAARDEDEAKVSEYYKIIATVLDDIFSRI